MSDGLIPFGHQRNVEISGSFEVVKFQMEASNTNNESHEERVTIMITSAEREVILRFGYPFDDIENQLKNAGDLDLMRITDDPYWWEQVIVNLHISENENAANPVIMNQLRALIDRIAEHLHLHLHLHLQPE